MKATFTGRRKWILEDRPQPVAETLDCFPKLKNLKYVSHYSIILYFNTLAKSEAPNPGSVFTLILLQLLHLQREFLCIVKTELNGNTDNLYSRVQTSWRTLCPKLLKLCDIECDKNHIFKEKLGLLSPEEGTFASVHAVIY